MHGVGEAQPGRRRIPRRQPQARRAAGAPRRSAAAAQRRPHYLATAARMGRGARRCARRKACIALFTLTRCPGLRACAPQVVKQAEQQILARELSGAENKEYLAMDGLPAFNKATAKLLFGDLPALGEGRVATIQGLSVRHATRRPGCLRAAPAGARLSPEAAWPSHALTRAGLARAGHGVASAGRRLHRQVHAGPGALWAQRAAAGRAAR